jgi:hypothetical protein
MRRDLNKAEYLKMRKRKPDKPGTKIILGWLS